MLKRTPAYASTRCPDPKHAVGVAICAALGFLPTLSHSAGTPVDEPQNRTVMTASRDFAADNVGNAVYLHWSAVPQGAALLRISRGPSAQGPWLIVANIADPANAPSSVADDVDGTRQDWYYRLEAIASTGAILRTYPILRVPQATSD